MEGTGPGIRWGFPPQVPENMTMADTQPTAAELEAFRRWQEANPTAAPGPYWLNVEKYGNADYDAAIFLRVLPDGQTLRVEIKHSGWLHELWNYIPKQGRRPAAGNGAYALRRRAQQAYYASPDAAKDTALIESRIPDEAKKDPRVWAEPVKKAPAKEKKSGPKGMQPAA